VIKYIKRLLNWLQTTGDQYRQETSVINSWPFPVESKPVEKQVKKRPQVKKATTRAVVKKATVVAKKTTKAKKK
jgi:hypothetical protein